MLIGILLLNLIVPDDLIYAAVISMVVARKLTYTSGKQRFESINGMFVKIKSICVAANPTVNAIKRIRVAGKVTFEEGERICPRVYHTFAAVKRFCVAVYRMFFAVKGTCIEVKRSNA
jgi:hypothetical protein